MVLGRMGIPAVMHPGPHPQLQHRTPHLHPGGRVRRRERGMGGGRGGGRGRGVLLMVLGRMGITAEEGRYIATWKREFKLPWRKAGLLKLSR